MRRVLLPVDFETGRTYQLSSNQVHHLLNVMRMKSGETIHLFDGTSRQEAEATLQVESKRKASVTINSLEPINRESSLQTTLCQALSPSDRMDYAIQKAVELGVSFIQPLYTERSLSPIKADRLEKKLSHWNGVIQHATEQSGRTVLTKIAAPVTLEHYLNSKNQETCLWLSLDTKESVLSSDINPAQPLHLLVGPVGGFSAKEEKMAEDMKVTKVSLGPRILRTETAGIALLSILQARWGYG